MIINPKKGKVSSMFCQACGNQMPDGTKFCPKCGTAQNGGQVVQAQTTVDERETLLKMINNSTDVIKAIVEAEKKTLVSKKELDKYTKASSNTSLIVVAVIMVVLMIATGSFVAPLILGSPFLAGGIVLKIVNTKKKNECQKVYDEDIDTLERLMSDEKLSWLPFDYRDSFSMGHIITYLQNMRARNIQEAINLLETELHQARVEALSASAAAYAKDAASAARSNW